MKEEKKLQNRLGLSIAFIAAVINVIFANPVLAQEGTFHAKTGTYVGISIANNTVEGDFDGETILEGDNEVLLVPEVDSGTGLKIVLGSRRASSAFEVSYVQSDHDISFQGVFPSEAKLVLLNFDWKSFFVTDQRLQPFILYGFNFAQLTAENYSTDLKTVDDAKFTGLGLNLGGGVAYYITPHVAVNAALTYRWVTYLLGEGVNDKGSLEDNLNSNSLNYDIGVAFTF